MDREKVQCMLAWPYPSTVKDVRDFLGLTGYYRRFVKHYGMIATPLTNLLKINAFEWSAETQKAWDTLKLAMSTTPVSALPDFNVLFVVEVDACTKGIGGCTQSERKTCCIFQQALSLKHQSLSVYDNLGCR